MRMPQELMAEVVKLDQTQKCSAVNTGTAPRTAWTRGIVWVKTGYGQLKKRYGPRYTSAMLGAAFVGLFLPIPGSSLLCVAVVVSIAEVHRAVFRPARRPPMHMADLGVQPSRHESRKDPEKEQRDSREERQANHRKTQAGASTGNGGKGKHIQAEERAKVGG